MSRAEGGERPAARPEARAVVAGTFACRWAHGGVSGSPRARARERGRRAWCSLLVLRTRSVLECAGGRGCQLTGVLADAHAASNIEYRPFVACVWDFTMSSSRDGSRPGRVHSSFGRPLDLSGDSLAGINGGSG